MFKLSKLIVVVLGCYMLVNSSASMSDVYPIHNCPHPRFNTDRRGCGNWQLYWDRANVAHWANCAWNHAARACWDQSWELWKCPPRRGGIPITLGDMINFHDWSVNVFRDAHDDGEWQNHPRASRAWQYINGISTDLSELGYAKRHEIEASILSLTNDDIIHLATILLRYSSINDTLDGFNYLIARVPRCSNNPQVDEKLYKVKNEWEKLRNP
ncbi:MAG: hypothetical protein AB2777_20815 [Candidatus Thiodiazotropha endolucinida]